MEYMYLGSTGLKVSRICLGAMSYGSSKWRKWVLDEDESQPFFKRAIELGINFFDTADMYSLGMSEEVTGRALHNYARRDEVVIASKVFYPLKDGPNQGGLSRAHILRSIDDSLHRLGVDYLDLYQIHRYDPETPLEETLETLNDIVRAGKVRYIGASSMFAWQFTKSLYLAEIHGWTRFVSMQNHYNLIYREEEREMIPLCIEEGVGIIPWSPLARGLLTGTRRRDYRGETSRSQTDTYAYQMYHDSSDFEIVDRVIKVAGEHGVKPAQIALAWLLHKKGVTAPIIGATQLKHLEEAVGAVDIKLTEEEICYLEEPYLPHSVRGHQ